MSMSPKFLTSFAAIDLNVDSSLELLEQIALIGAKSGLVKSSWSAAVIEREKSFPTGLPTPIPVAIPHTDSIHVFSDGIGFFRTVKPASFGEMGATDSFLDVQIIIPLLITNHEEQINLLMKVITAVQDEEFVANLLKASNLAEVGSLFAEKEL